MNNSVLSAPGSRPTGRSKTRLPGVQSALDRGADPADTSVQVDPASILQEVTRSRS
jgi:hypothetical protein